MQEEIVTTNNKMIELKNYESVLIVEDAKSLRVTVNNILKILQDKPVIYLNLTNIYNSLMSDLKKDGIKINNILFIDCITQIVGGNDSNQENVIFIKNPNDLTSIGIAISQFFESIPDEKWLILYAFSILKIYNKEDTILRFIQSIFENASANNAKIVILSTQIKNENLIKKMALFFEKVVMGNE
ncbi:MAG: hypothetical protein MUO82_12270 [Candidatus Thermoplasmatota archaeon]|nr:hypothetical protein [Candidatus Thermoplasmatota archaeon]